MLPFTRFQKWSVFGEGPIPGPGLEASARFVRQGRSLLPGQTGPGPNWQGEKRRTLKHQHLKAAEKERKLNPFKDDGGGP